MTEEVFDGLLFGIVVYERRAEVQTDHAVPLHDLTCHVVGQVARVSAEGAEIGMRGDDRLFRDLREIPETPVGNVRYVENHAETVPFRDDFTSEVGKTGVPFPVVAVALRHVVAQPCYAEYAHTGFPYGAEVFHRVETKPAFHGQKCRVLSGGERRFDVRVRPDGQNNVRFVNHRLIENVNIMPRTVPRILFGILRMRAEHRHHLKLLILLTVIIRIHERLSSNHRYAVTMRVHYKHKSILQICTNFVSIIG